MTLHYVEAKSFQLLKNKKFDYFIIFIDIISLILISIDDPLLDPNS